jgi:hypothetical protein
MDSKQLKLEIVKHWQTNHMGKGYVEDPVVEVWGLGDDEKEFLSDYRPESDVDAIFESLLHLNDSIEKYSLISQAMLILADDEDNFVRKVEDFIRLAKSCGRIAVEAENYRIQWERRPDGWCNTVAFLEHVSWIGKSF